jgi:predicted helicase
MTKKKSLDERIVAHKNDYENRLKELIKGPAKEPFEQLTADLKKMTNITMTEKDVLEFISVFIFTFPLNMGLFGPNFLKRPIFDLLEPLLIAVNFESFTDHLPELKEFFDKTLKESGFTPKS